MYLMLCFQILLKQIENIPMAVNVTNYSLLILLPNPFNFYSTFSVCIDLANIN